MQVFILSVIGVLISLSSAASVYFVMLENEPELVVPIEVAAPVATTSTTTTKEIVEPVKEKQSAPVKKKPVQQEARPPVTKQTSVSAPAKNIPAPAEQKDYKDILITYLLGMKSDMVNLREYGDLSIELIEKRQRELRKKVVEIRKLEIYASGTKYENMFSTYKEMHQLEKKSLDFDIGKFEQNDTILVGVIGEFDKKIAEFRSYAQPLSKDFVVQYIEDIEAQDAWREFFDPMKDLNRQVTERMTRYSGQYDAAFDTIQSSLDRDALNVSSSLKSGYQTISPIPYYMPSFQSPTRCTSHTDYFTGRTDMECY